jgi:HSP20 family molecular chaperone IbpA
MVIKSSDDKETSGPSMNSQASQSTAAAANAGYGPGMFIPGMRNNYPESRIPDMFPFMRRGMRGHGWRGGMRHIGPHGGHRPEVVSLEGEQAHAGSPSHGHGAFWGPTPPDPPLAPMPPVAPEAPTPPPPPPHPFNFGGVPPHFEGFASLVGEHARNFYGDLAAQFTPPPPGSPGSHPHRGPMGWRGRRGGGHWRGRWGPPGPAHGHHHPPGHFPHHQHGPIRPKMNIQHTGNVFTVTLELPGLQKEEVEISVSEGILTVSGEFVDNASPNVPEAFNIPPGYEAEGFEMMDESGTLYGDDQELEDGVDAMNLNANHPDSGGFILRERRFGPFKRSIKLPAWVDVDAIKATMAHGVLSLVVEKPEEEERGVPAKKITVL